MRLMGTLFLGFFLTALSYWWFSFFWEDYQPQENLRVYTYSSFSSSWGPGRKLAERFEERFNIKINFIDVGDTVLLMERVKLDAPKYKVDLVIGLDRFLLSEASKDWSWHKVELPYIKWAADLKKIESPVVVDNHFVPLDWGPLAFVYRTKDDVPPVEKFDDLLKDFFDHSIGIQDPRTSTPGMQFLIWVLAVKGEKEGFEYLKKLLEKVHSVAPSWGKSYGLYQRGVLKTTASYLTSPVYHWKEEETEGKKQKNHQPMVFKEGHVAQIEYMAIPKGTKKLKIAKKLMEYLLSAEGQKIIMEKNFMFPVVEGVKKGTFFEELPHVKIIENKKTEAFFKNRSELIKKWEQIRRYGK